MQYELKHSKKKERVPAIYFILMTTMFNFNYLPSLGVGSIVQDVDGDDGAGAVDDVEDQRGGGPPGAVNDGQRVEHTALLLHMRCDCNGKIYKIRNISGEDTT